MKINDKYSIKSIDTLNVVLYEHGTVQDEKSENFGKPTKTPVGYFPNLEKTLEHLIDREINGTGVEQLKVIVMKSKNLRNLLKELY